MILRVLNLFLIATLAVSVPSVPARAAPDASSDLGDPNGANPEDPISDDFLQSGGVTRPALVAFFL